MHENVRHEHYKELLHQKKTSIKLTGDVRKFEAGPFINKTELLKTFKALCKTDGKNTENCS